MRPVLSDEDAVDLRQQNAERFPELAERRSHSLPFVADVDVLRELHHYHREADEGQRPNSLSQVEESARRRIAHLMKRV